MEYQKQLNPFYLAESQSMNTIQPNYTASTLHNQSNADLQPEISHNIGLSTTGWQPPALKNSKISFNNLMRGMQKDVKTANKELKWQA